jgi:hypothetical protein
MMGWGSMWAQHEWNAKVVWALSPGFGGDVLQLPFRYTGFAAGLGSVGPLCFLTHFVGGLAGPSCSCCSSLSFPLVKEGMGGIWHVEVLRFGGCSCCCCYSDSLVGRIGPFCWHSFSGFMG